MFTENFNLNNRKLAFLRKKMNEYTFTMERKEF